MSSCFFEAEPMKKVTIDYKCEEFLRTYSPENLMKPTPLDIEKAVGTLWSCNRYKLHLTDDIPKGIEARTDFLRRRVQIRELDWEKACSQYSIANRFRYTMSHEIGHVILHSVYFDEKRIFMNRKINKKKVEIFCDPEWQAYYAGGAILMPKSVVVPFFHELKRSNHFDELIVPIIAQTFRVSEISARKRLEKLELIRKKPSGPTWRY